MEAEFRFSKLQVLALLTLLFAAAFALGQGIATGSISGTVVDPTGAVVSLATVSAQNVETGLALTGQTNDAGYFTFRSVPPGTYKVTVEAKGFRKVQMSQVTVQVARDSSLGSVKMDLSTTGETVEVIEAAPILETNTAQVTNTFDTKATADLPTGGGFDSLALYLPGVADTGSNNFSNTNGAGFSSNGLRGRSNNFQIDGQNNNDNSVAGPSIFLGNQDLLGEVSIITNDFSVEYGRASGTVVNYVTKSGTNQFHGSAFEYWTGSWADSHTNEEKSTVFGFCAPGEDPGDGCEPVAPISRYVENRFGFTGGGPIVKDKAWFFGSGFWDRVRSAGITYNSGGALTPTPDGLTQLAEAFPGNPAVAALQAIGPYSVTTGNPRPIGDVVPTLVSDGDTSATIDFAQIARNPPSFYNDREFSGRVDVNVSSKDRLGARYIFQQNIFTVATAANTAAFAAGYWVDIPARDQQIAIDWTRTVSSQMVNQARYSFSRASVPFEGGSFPNCTRNTITDCPTNIAFANGLQTFGMATNLPQGRTIDTTQIQDNASWAMGRHTLKFGGEFLKQRSPNVFLPSINGGYLFNTFDDFLQDNPVRLNLTDGPTKLNFKEHDLAFYFGDDWRIKDNLTLNLGLRWEYASQAINLLHDLSSATQHGSDPFWDTSLPDSVTTVPKIGTPLNYFGPNVGFAWKPGFLGGGDKNVIRGGFRITYDPAFYNMFLNVATAAPNVNAGTITPVAGLCGGAPCLPSSGFTGNDVRALQLPSIPRGGNPGTRNYTQVAPNFHEPYTENWSLGIQREVTRGAVLEVRYVGNHSVGNFQTLNANPALNGLIANGFSSFIPDGITPCSDSSQPGFSGGRALCSNRNIRNRANTSFSRYDGLQSTFRIAEWHGISGAASFTWSKTMDNTSEIFSTGSGGNSTAGAQNPFDTSAGEKSVSGLDFPKNASLYIIYDFPFYKGQHGFLGKLLGGYQANATWRYTSGQNYTPITLAGVSSSCQSSFDASFYGWSTCRPFLGNPAAPLDTVGGCTDPSAPDCGLVNWDLLFEDGILSPVSKNDVHWIYNEDAAAQFFGTPYSPVRRNPGTRGQNVNTINFSMFKTTKINERVTFRLEAQVYNLFNHQFRGVPDPFIDDCSFADRGPDVCGFGGSFANTLFNPSGGDSTNVTLNGLGRRRMILGGKFTF